MLWNRSPFGYPSRPLEGCPKSKLRGRIAKAAQVVLYDDQTLVREAEDGRSLLCQLEAF